MMPKRTRMLSWALALVINATLFISSWWYLQLSFCAGDLKSGTGDTFTALALENTAFYLHLAGVTALCVLVFIRHYRRTPWRIARHLALVAAAPILASISFALMAFSSSHIALKYC